MTARKYIQPDGKVDLNLTADERKLLLGVVLLLDHDDALAQTIRDTPPDRPAQLTLDELERLAEDLAAASRRAEDQTIRAETDRLYGRVDTLIELSND